VILDADMLGPVRLLADLPKVLVSGKPVDVRRLFDEAVDHCVVRIKSHGVGSARRYTVESGEVLLSGSAFLEQRNTEHQVGFILTTPRY
jgi:hypothetical protein